MTEHDGTGIGTSQIQITLGRGDLGTKLECRASNPTLDTPMIAWVEVDVYGKSAPEICYQEWARARLTPFLYSLYPRKADSFNQRNFLRGRAKLITRFLIWLSSCSAPTTVGPYKLFYKSWFYKSRPGIKPSWISIEEMKPQNRLYILDIKNKLFAIKTHRKEIMYRENREEQGKKLFLNKVGISLLPFDIGRGIKKVRSTRRKF